MNSFDVIVVGAGPGGACSAYFLSKNGANVLLLDKANFPRDKTCGDALSPRALIVLRKMGVLREVEDTGYLTDS
ncbi:MAG: FAD-dependent oxidoreductase, partial [Chloroflexi bacterium]|nr:FAD-dependent oxidoreductase [Chloroflexota bacterium]